ncbi:ThuA domain-containing protein [Streptomyces sp. DW26H14]|uniref:ThuA domain-containing protein n=1 Tax=Streptomyces sp. DW26H14 TaxID=3435395 RepID=UPI00403D9AE0
MRHPPAPRAMVVVNGDDLRHDLLSAAQVFQQLGVEAGFATRRAMGTGRFADPLPPTAQTDVFLLYTAGGQFAPRQQRALAAAVEAGKGLVGVHRANAAGHPEGTALSELFGSRSGPEGDGDGGRHTVAIAAEHPITRGVRDFDVQDTYGAVELAGDVSVLATGRGPDGAAVPVLHAREAGLGRVAYLALGHDMRSWGEPGVRALVRGALCWAAHREAPGGEPAEDRRRTDGN